MNTFLYIYALDVSLGRLNLHVHAYLGCPDIIMLDKYPRRRGQRPDIIIAVDKDAKQLIKQKNILINLVYFEILNEFNTTLENKHYAYLQTKTQISCAVTAQLISVFVFATQIVKCLSFLHPKFQTSSSVL